jgi:oligopeptide transport system substrate-binding protein
LPLAEKDKPFNLFLSHWFGDYPDPEDFLGASQVRSWTGWQDTTFIDLLEQTRSTNDLSKRLGLYAQADKVLTESAVILPLTYDRQHLLIKPWVKRYPTSPLYTWFWKDVVIEPH